MVNVAKTRQNYPAFEISENRPKTRKASLLVLLHSSARSLIPASFLMARPFYGRRKRPHAAQTLIAKNPPQTFIKVEQVLNHR
jgi:hypothetical protein